MTEKDPGKKRDDVKKTQLWLIFYGLWVQYGSADGSDGSKPITISGDILGSGHPDHLTRRKTGF